LIVIRGAIAPRITIATLSGSLACTGNTPAPGDRGAVNTVSGTASGQCTALATR